MEFRVSDFVIVLQECKIQWKRKWYMAWKLLLKAEQPQDAGGVNPNQAAPLSSQLLHETNSKKLEDF